MTVARDSDFVAKQSRRKTFLSESGKSAASNAFQSTAEESSRANGSRNAVENATTVAGSRRVFRRRLIVGYFGQSRVWMVVGRGR